MTANTDYEENVLDRTRIGLFALLLGGFALIQKKESIVRIDPARVEGLLSGHRDAIEKDRLSLEATADNFNILDVLQTTYKESRHSMVLAWLLAADHRRLGTHSQGSLGFRLFLEEVKLPPDFALRRYWVRREVIGDEARVDLEIACHGQFLIHIENKIMAREGNLQTEREWSDLLRRANSLEISDRRNIYGFFLTPSGISPANPNFVPISWQAIGRVLARFSELAKPQDVKLFAMHYSRALRRFVLREEHREG